MVHTRRRDSTSGRANPRRGSIDRLAHARRTLQWRSVVSAPMWPLITGVILLMLARGPYSPLLFTDAELPMTANGERLRWNLVVSLERADDGYRAWIDGRQMQPNQVRQYSRAVFRARRSQFEKSLARSHRHPSYSLVAPIDMPWPVVRRAMSDLGAGGFWDRDFVVQLY